MAERADLEFLNGRPANAISPNFADLFFLFTTVRKRKPACILEFGSGCSTAIMAQALWRNARDTPGHDGRLYSVETDPYWADVTAQSMPPQFKGFCELRNTAVAEIDYGGTRAWRHNDVPSVTPDLIYLDGPPLSTEVEVAIDVLDIETRLQPGCLIVVDGRWTNTKFLRANFRRRFSFKHNPWLFNSVFELIG